MFWKELRKKRRFDSRLLGEETVTKKIRQGLGGQDKRIWAMRSLQKTKTLKRSSLLL